MKWETTYKREAQKERLAPEGLLDVLLKNRGINTKKGKKEFLSPRHPLNISGPEAGIGKKELERAAKRVRVAIENKEQIVVYGDYDADGICATAVMWELLDSLGADALPYIPNRFDEGYGLSAQSVKLLKNKFKNLGLIITVDNGIVAYDGVNAANELGIDVIISDHHEAGEKLPKAFAVVHTTRTSGAGVAWFLANEIGGVSKKNTRAGLELVAIGVVADQLPLLEVNRSLVKFGLDELNKTRRIGLRKLFMVSGLLEREIGTYEIGFVIAPRLNASGRMAAAMDALRLLCTRSSSRAEGLAKLLDELNLERQNIVGEALALAEKNLPREPEAVVVMADEHYHEGVIGLIAGKVAERFNRPAVVLSVRGEIAKASARSVAGLNIIEAIRAHQSLIIEGGGHEMAAGFSIEAKKIPVFTKRINQYVKTLLTPEILSRKIRIDMELPFSLITERVYNTLKALEPHGVGNPAPLFATKGVGVVSQKLVGKTNNHLKMVLEKDGREIEAVSFNREAAATDKIDICYRLTENTWNGRAKIELNVKDIRWSKSSNS